MNALEKFALENIEAYELDTKLKFLVALDTADLNKLEEAYKEATSAIKETRGLPTEMGRPKTSVETEAMKEHLLRLAITIKAYQKGLSYTAAYQAYFLSYSFPQKQTRRRTQVGDGRIFRDKGCNIVWDHLSFTGTVAEIAALEQAAHIEELRYYCENKVLVAKNNDGNDIIIDDGRLMTHESGNSEFARWVRGLVNKAEIEMLEIG